MTDNYAEISNADDVIDSRDVIAHIDVYQALIGDETAEESERQHARDVLPALLALQDEAECSPDWRYGETLVRDSYFHEYAQVLAEDIGAVPADLQWPLTCIDWEQAARELQMDYFSVDFDGVTYWIRS